MNIIGAYTMIGYKNRYGLFSRSASKRHGRGSPHPSILAGMRELARKLEEIEKKYDAQFKVVCDAIRVTWGAFRRTSCSNCPRKRQAL